MASKASPRMAIVSDTPAADAAPGIKMPEIHKVTKVAAWRINDDEYHENFESLKESLTSSALADFLEINGLTKRPQDIPAALAKYMSAIDRAVEAEIKKIK